MQGVEGGELAPGGESGPPVEGPELPSGEMVVGQDGQVYHNSPPDHLKVRDWASFIKKKTECQIDKVKVSNLVQSHHKIWHLFGKFAR